jgi:L-cystine uptake protein TcyP (sodium:dicarboxylate symporter family)
MDKNGNLNATSLLFEIALVISFLALIAGMIVLRKLRLGKHGEDGKRKKLPFGIIMLIALAIGTAFGLILKGVWGMGVYPAFGVNAALEWINIPAALFLQALELIVVPLVLVSIIRSFLKVGVGKEAAKGGVILAVLLVTVAASAAIGYFMVKLFGLDPTNLQLTSIAANKPTTIIETIHGIVPNNFVKALSSNTALPVVFLGVLIAAAALAVKKYNEEYGLMFEKGIEIAYEIIGTIVDFIIMFTPFAVLSLVSVQISINDWSVFLTLGGFIGAFYTGIALIAVMHILLLAVFGTNLKEFFRKTASTYLFAFSTNSSIATLPLTIKSQKELGVSDSTANISGTLGTCVGQNACAGLYPAMLATVVALFMGQNPWTVSFAAQVILFAAISSIGVAGVGGGNIQASLLLLAMLGLPYQLITLFLSVDFIVGLSRPPVNVSGSLVAGMITQRISDIFSKKRDKSSLEAEPIV